MSQQVNVYESLNFMGAAAHQGNTGLIIPQKKIFDCGFSADQDESDWTEEADNGTTIAHSSTDGGEVTITAGGTNDDCGELFHTAQWSPASNCGMLAKLKISQKSDICVAVGMVDAFENLNDHIAIEMNAAAFRDTTNTADFCGMVFDTDATTDVWYYGCSEDGTEGTPVAAVGSLEPSAGTYFYVALQTDTDGNVTFYYGTAIDRLTAVGYSAEGIASTSSDLLTPYVGFISRSTDAAVCTISRIITWQDN